MARYTITNLRAFVKDMNEQYPLKEKNGYGDYDRFKIDCAYGGYSVDLMSPNSTGHGNCGCYGHYSAREAQEKFSHWLAYNAPFND